MIPKPVVPSVSDFIRQVHLIEQQIEAARSAVVAAEEQFKKEVTAFDRLRAKLTFSVSAEKIKLQLMTADIQIFHDVDIETWFILCCKVFFEGPQS